MHLLLCFPEQEYLFGRSSLAKKKGKELDSTQRGRTQQVRVGLVIPNW